MKRSLIDNIKTPTVRSAEDILSKAGTEDIFEKAKHQDGDMHPNGKWVWVASANSGKGDWRTHGGRAHKKHQAGGSATSGSGASTSKTTATQSSGQSKTPKAKPTKPKQSNTSFGSLDIKDAKKELMGRKITLKRYFFDGVSKYKDGEGVVSKVYLQGKNKTPFVTIDFSNGDSASFPIKDIDSGKTMGYDLQISDKTSSKSTESKTDKEQKKLRPVGTGTNGPERRRKETKSSKKSLTMESVKEDDLKDCKPGSVIKTKRPGNGTPITYTKTSSGKWDYEDGFRDKKDYLTDGEVARHIRSMSDKKLYPGYSTDFSSLK